MGSLTNLSGTASKAIPSHFAALQIFTSGQAARACRVAPRTISKWFDSGQLQGYRMPGSADRRIPRDQFVKFLEANGMAAALAAISPVAEPAAVGVECAVPGEVPAGWSRRRADYATGLLAAATDPKVRAVLVHAGVGLAMAREFAAAVRDARLNRPPLLVYLTAADLWPATTPTGFDAVLTEPADPAAFWPLAEAAVTS